MEVQQKTGAINTALCRQYPFRSSAKMSLITGMETGYEKDFCGLDSNYGSRE
jgi:hypothetical protein